MENSLDRIGDVARLQACFAQIFRNLGWPYSSQALQAAALHLAAQPRFFGLEADQPTQHFAHQLSATVRFDLKGPKQSKLGFLILLSQSTKCTKSWRTMNCS